MNEIHLASHSCIIHALYVLCRYIYHKMGSWRAKKKDERFFSFLARQKVWPYISGRAPTLTLSELMMLNATTFLIQHHRRHDSHEEIYQYKVTLQQLILREEWEEVRSLLGSKKAKELLRFQNKDGDLPMHVIAGGNRTIHSSY